MSTYKRGGVWWYKFQFQGVSVRESSGFSNKNAARAAEDRRHNSLREARSGTIAPQSRIPMFSVAAVNWLAAKTAEWAPKTAVIERTNLTHLEPFFKNNLLSDIGPADVGLYRDRRLLRDGAAHKTISLEIGTLRSMMLFHDLDANWRAIKKKIKLKKARNIGRVITVGEEEALLRECRASRSRSLYVATVLALQTCMRYSEIRLLQWRQVDLGRRVITVGHSKTEAGEGRVIPLTRVAQEILLAWAATFPNKKPNHYLFQSEQYGQGAVAYSMDPNRPIGTWKEAWEAAKRRSGVDCRFHDLRHTACTRLLDAGVSHPVVAEIMGWSTSTAIRMIKEVYGHINLATKQRAIEQGEQFIASQSTSGSAQEWAQSEKLKNARIQ
jgi:integrase